MDLDKLRFSKEHEWVTLTDSNGESLVGITDYAAGELGDIVYIELPEVGSEIEFMEPMGTIEAVKTVADIFAPVSGTISEINSKLEDEPELVNKSPYEEGWFVKVKLRDSAELEQLMTHEDYQKLIGKA